MQTFNKKNDPSLIDILTKSTFLGYRPFLFQHIFPS